jgi:Secretion system C-terminal sorting domain
MNRIKYTIQIVIIGALLGTRAIFAQLDIYPAKLEFKDTWNRLKNITIVNKGAQAVTIDSIYYKSNVNYNSNFYLTRFNKYGDFPFVLNSGDTAIMDCILSGYFSVTSQDTSDTMLIATSSKIAKIGIKIDYVSGYYYYGVVGGEITDGQAPLDSASVLFFYEGNFLFKTVTAQSSGRYSAELPPGEYTVAVDRPSYPLTFYNGQPDPNCANSIAVRQNDSLQINFNLTKAAQTGYTVSGKVLDQRSGALLRRGIIVVRRGTHTPSKLNQNSEDNEYAGIINSDGSFKIENIASGNYLVQSLSSYYVPTYYTSGTKNITFWQDANSLTVNQNIQNTSISMPRDSSVGGGTISGKIFSDDLSIDFCDITIYAYSLINNDTTIYSYAFADDSGNYKITGLPVGNYRLIAQKIGYPDALSNTKLVISEQETALTGANLYFDQDTGGDKTIPPTTMLYQNYPNPFNPVTIIEFYVVKNSAISLKIRNTLGQQVAVLYEGYLPAGTYSFKFNGNNLASGVYFAALVSNGMLQTKKMLLLK